MVSLAGWRGGLSNYFIHQLGAWLALTSQRGSWASFKDPLSLINFNSSPIKPGKGLRHQISGTLYHPVNQTKAEHSSH